MALYVTVNEIKQQAGVDLAFIEDDYYISSLIDGAELSIAARAGIDLTDHVTAGLLNAYLKRAIIFLAATWYDSRFNYITGTIVAQLPYTMDDILQDFNKYGVA